MTKKLTSILEQELFNLHQGCWNGAGLKSYGITLYAKKISELFSEGYDVKDHMRFASYYRGKMIPLSQYEKELIEAKVNGSNGNGNGNGNGVLGKGHGFIDEESLETL